MLSAVPDEGFSASRVRACFGSASITGVIFYPSATTGGVTSSGLSNF